MSSFNDREEAFEKKFAHDQELHFKVEARACKLIGLWAAEQMGLEGGEAEAYAKSVVSENLREAGLDDVKGKIAADFKARNVSVSDHVIGRELDKAMDEAKKQIAAGK